MPLKQFLLKRSTISVLIYMQPRLFQWTEVCMFGAGLWKPTFKIPGFL